MTGAAQSRLEYSTRLLIREFSELPSEAVVREVEAVAHALLGAARFDDYIPVLTHRFVRDRLRNRPDPGAEGVAEAA